MPKFLYEAVLEYIEALYEIGPEDRIFYFTHGAVNREIDRIAKLAGVTRIRVHDLRHSHAALMIELGYSIVAVAERLGDSVKVAMETYSHLYPGKMDALADDLERHAAGEALEVRPEQKSNLEDLLETLETAEKGEKNEK
jgi:integrase